MTVDTGRFVSLSLYFCVLETQNRIENMVSNLIDGCDYGKATTTVLKIENFNAYFGIEIKGNGTNVQSDKDAERQRHRETKRDSERIFQRSQNYLLTLP